MGSTSVEAEFWRSSRPFFARHSTLSGQPLDFWQLHFLLESFLLFFSAFIFPLLSPSIMTTKLGMQLYDNLTVFLLNTLWRLFDSGKHWSIILGTPCSFLLYGGLYQMILYFLVFSCFFCLPVTQQKDITYQATVTSGRETETYVGLLTATTFKARYGNHKASFNSVSKHNATELNKHI